VHTDAAAAAHVPARQPVHTDAPAAAHVPAAQSTHVLPDKYCPAAQVTATHAPSAVAPVPVEVFPATQAVHPLELLTPTALEYLPAAHFIHLVKSTEPVALTYVPATQFAHDVKELKIPVLPAGHATHCDMPVTAAYEPGSQDVQHEP
jgi:hypothetical protein